MRRQHRRCLRQFAHARSRERQIARIKVGQHDGATVPQAPRHRTSMAATTRGAVGHHLATPWREQFEDLIHHHGDVAGWIHALRPDPPECRTPAVPSRVLGSATTLAVQP